MYNTWPWKVGLALSQLFNAILGGWPDETFCSRCYRWKRDGIRAWPCNVLDAIVFFDNKDGVRHCQKAFNHEREERHSPPELRS